MRARQMATQIVDEQRIVGRFKNDKLRCSCGKRRKNREGKVMGYILQETCRICRAGAHGMLFIEHWQPKEKPELPEHSLSYVS